MSNPVPWQNWMVAYLGYTLRMKTLFRGWPIMVNDTHTRRRRLTPSHVSSVADEKFCPKLHVTVYRVVQKISPYTDENFSTRVKKCCFLILHGSMLTCMKWDISVLWSAEFILVNVVQKLLKLVQIWKSCCKTFTFTFLWTTALHTCTCN